MVRELCRRCGTPPMHSTSHRFRAANEFRPRRVLLSRASYLWSEEAMSLRIARWLMLLFVAGASSMISAAQQQPLIIRSQAVPSGIAGVPYVFQLAAQGDFAPHSWGISDGNLPPGLELDERKGVISGTPGSPGEFKFTLRLSDSAVPPEQVERIFVIKIIAALSVEWKQPPSIKGEGISGEIAVTNHTGLAVDLTVIVLAVNELGKAFALGYQHFTLKPETVSPTIPFGSTLPYGSYVVHADAVGELESANRIYRARLQTPEALVVKAR